MDKLAEFVSQHMSDDTARLIMNRSKWPETDIDLAVNCIESRRKLKGKVREWYENPFLIFPLKLSAEQCSSSATGRHKARTACRIAMTGRNGADESRGWKIADLTGGLGVDSWFFSLQASEVLYNEMQECLCEAAAHNFRSLKADNIRISNRIAEKGHIGEILGDFRPDIVYMDPARRGEGGKKVFLIEECTPDVITLKEEIFLHSRHILLKLSPMADITMVCDRLGRCCREVHVVAAGGECKELLVWMDREWDQEYMIHAVELHKDSEAGVITFGVAEEKTAMAKPFDIDIYQEAVRQEEKSIYLLEPGKALMKAGAFNLISERFEISKLGTSTHYYIFDDEQKHGVLKQHGKVFRIIRMEPLDKRTIKAAGKEFPKAEVTARNIPMDTDTLRKKLGVTSGDDAHIFGLKSDSLGNLLLCTNRVLQ